MKLDPLDVFLYKEQMKEKKAPKEEPKKEPEPSARNYIALAAVLLALIVFGIAFGKLLLKPKEVYSGPVHWQAKVEIELCGEPVSLPTDESGKIGSDLLTTRNDDVIHVEGIVPSRDAIELGAFFDAIEVPFSSDTIMDKQNGDQCDGEAGKVMMSVNGKPRTDYRNYLISPTREAEDQVIRIVFAPGKSV